MSESGKRVCLLTGASGRLGSMFCRLYSHRYDIVAVSCTKPVPLPACMSWRVDPLQPDVRSPESPRSFLTLQADLTDPSQVPRVVEFALTSLGRVDLLVHAAASVRCDPLLDAGLNTADMARMFDLNALVPLRLAAELARQFWQSRSEENAAMNRNVINVSSTSGAYIFPGLGQAGYSASKAALNMLTCHMAEEFAAFGVRANAIAPDTFPERVTTESVCDEIARVDRGAMNGELLMLEPASST